MSINYKVGDMDFRPWGKWETIDVGENYVIKKITVNPAGKLSLQKHKYRLEHWVITQGEGVVTLNDSVATYKKDDHILIPIGTIHRIENQTNEPLVFIEIQQGSVLDENDIIRLEDIYNRV